jgi:hypothetical protein
VLAVCGRQPAEVAGVVGAGQLDPSLRGHDPTLRSRH